MHRNVFEEIFFEDQERVFAFWFNQLVDGGVQPSAANRKVIGGVSLQTRPRVGFLNLPLKTSLQGWHGTWFYCENHEPSLPSFVGRVLEFQGTWSEEPTPQELPQVTALGQSFKEQNISGVGVAAHWLPCRVQPLKKQVHPDREYCGL
jgi:hypothetical protein